MITRMNLLLITCLIVLLSACNDNERNQPQSDSNAQKNDTSGMMGGGMMGEGMMGEDGMMQDGMMSEEMRKAMMSRGMGPEMMEDMGVIRSMLMNHEKIERRVENLENGVRTRTESDDPEVAAAIQTHVRQMKERVEEKKPIRQMDPLFREIFEHADKIEMQIEDTEHGVIVVETSEDPQVVKLIQQHANRAVSEFAEKGMQRAMQPTPLPEGYNE